MKITSDSETKAQSRQDWEKEKVEEEEENISDEERTGVYYPGF